MDFVYIDETQLPHFSSLLLPEVADYLAEGAPWMLALGAVQEGIACGCVAGFARSGLFTICSLYVAPAYRRQGIGQSLVKALIRMCDGLTPRQVFQLEAPFHCTHPDHEGLIGFFPALGFTAQEEAGKSLYRTSLASTFQSPLFQRPFSPHPGYCLLQDLPEATRRSLATNLHRRHVPLPEGGLSYPGMDKQVSAVILRDGEAVALTIWDDSVLGQPTLALAWTHNTQTTTLMCLFLHTFSVYRNKFPPETPIWIQTTGSASSSLVEYILPQAQPVEHNYSFHLFPDSQVSAE